MARLVDTGLWIDLTRARSPQAVKNFVAPYINDSDACLAEPIVFELLLHATDAEARQLVALFQSVPRLADPADLWSRAARLGQACRKAGITVGGMDLLIAEVCIHHSAELITFDDDFQKIAGVSALQVKLLTRPALP